MQGQVAWARKGVCSVGFVSINPIGSFRAVFRTMKFLWVVGLRLLVVGSGVPFSRCFNALLVLKPHYQVLIWGTGCLIARLNVDPSCPVQHDISSSSILWLPLARAGPL